MRKGPNLDLFSGLMSQDEADKGQEEGYCYLIRLHVAVGLHG